jgi:hypothetical protein
MRPTALSLLALAACATSDPELVTVDPEPPVLRRLTQAQYTRAVRELFGEDLYVPDALEPDPRSFGLQSIGSSLTSISARGVENYEDAAYVIAEQALAPERRGRVVPCTPQATVDSACTAQTVRSLGLKVWRRPLTEAEVTAITAVADDGAEILGDFWQGLEFAIAALLQSPDFLMRPETGEPDPNGAGQRYTSWEMASRLSFLLWDSIPDEALLEAAERGELVTTEGVDAQVGRMLDSPKARQGLRAWLTDLLQLQDLDDLQKDPATFVYMSDGLGAAAREETLLGAEHIVFTEDSDLRSLLTTRRTFVDRDLAALYRVPAPAPEGFGEVMLPLDEPRVGLLGQVSTLALHAHATSSSPTLRGLFVRETLLCQPMPDPPANVDTSIPASTEAAPTLRDRVQAHLEQDGCSSCHLLTDPIGLGLEQFDGIGSFRTMDGGAPIDASGDLDGVPFKDAAGLALAVRDHPAFAPCLVEQLSRHALGRSTGEGEDEAADWLFARFAEREHRLQPLWMDLAVSPLFRQVGEVP